MYTGKIIVPTDTLTPETIDELQQQFKGFQWVSDKVVLMEFGPTKVNPADAYTWPLGTKIVLSWEAT